MGIIRSTQRPQLLLEGMLLHPPCRLLFGWWQSGIRTDVADSSIIDVFDGKTPSKQLFVGRMALLELMDIAQEMNPASLVQSQVGIVACLKVRTEHPLVGFSHQLGDNFARS
jgi:hypothetical protein